MYIFKYLKDRSLVKKQDKSNLIKCDGRIQLSKIKIKGKNNKILVGNKTNLRKSNVFIQGNNNQILLGRNCDLNKLNIKMIAENTTLKIGDLTSTGEAKIIIEENFNIEIGKDCMLSYGIEIRNSDSHKILNENSEIINKGKEIIIKDKVWIGSNVTILKGSCLEYGSIIGACSLVSGKIKEKSLAVGIPSKIIKENISWER